MSTRRAAILGGAATVLTVAVGVAQALRGFAPWQLLAWISALLLLLASAIGPALVARLVGCMREHRRWYVPLAALFLVPAVVRAAHVGLAFTHPDEFSLAYFSTHIDLATSNFFGPVPPEPVWTFQSPSLFFVVQKVILGVLGASPLNIKYSVLLYTVVTAAALFIAARELFHLEAAVASVLIYAVLAPSVYVEGFGVPNPMSTAFLLVFLDLALLWFRSPSFARSVLTGIACAFCYLAYSTSYAALPLLICFAALMAFQIAGRKVIAGLATCLGSCVVVLLPFIVGALRSRDYFLDRVAQVSPMCAQWLGRAVPRDEVTKAWSSTVSNWAAYAQYLWKDGVGGTGGFEFANRALLDPLSAVFLVLGSIVALFVVKRRRELVLVFLVVFVNLMAVGFANPPPHTQRVAVLFPYFALLMAVPAASLLALGERWRSVRVGIAALAVAALVAANFVHLEGARKQELLRGREDANDIKVALYLKEHFPEKRIAVAAFGGFHLQYTLSFFVPKADILTDYHDNILKSFGEDHRDVYVILFPEEFNKKFLAADPHGTLLTDISRKYSILVREPAPRPRG